MATERTRTQPATAGLAVAVLAFAVLGVVILRVNRDAANQWLFGYRELELPVTTITVAGGPPKLHIVPVPVATTTPTEKVTTPPVQKPASKPAPKPAPAPTPTPTFESRLPPGVVQGSFTELFSGTGWRDEAVSDAYHDQRMLSISLPPAYQQEAVPGMSAALAPLEKNIPLTGQGSSDVAAVGGNGREVVVIAKSGKAIAFRSERAAIGSPAVAAAKEGDWTPVAAPGFRSATLAYDETADRWVAALADAGGTRVAIFSVQPSGIVVTGRKQLTTLEVPNPEVTSFACAAGTCLAVIHSADGLSAEAGAKADEPRWSAYHFGIVGPPGGERETLLDNTIADPALAHLSIGTVGDHLAVGVVTLEKGLYHGTVSLLAVSSSNPLAVSSSNPLSPDGLQPVPGVTFVSEYAGDIAFGYDATHRDLLAVYHAGVGQAFLVHLADGTTDLSAGAVSAGQAGVAKAEDYSRFFNQRVLATGSDGNPGVTYRFFRQGDAWWGSSVIGSPLARLIRLQSGAGTDLTADAIGSRSAMVFVPGFESAVLYGVAPASAEAAADKPASVPLGGTAAGKAAAVFRFTNSGFEASATARWVSSKLNPPGTVVVAGMLKNREDGGAVTYSFSNDGGATWVRAKPDVGVIFDGAGSDFRFRAELSPSGGPAKSPWVHRIEVSYYYRVP